MAIEGSPIVTINAATGLSFALGRAFDRFLIQPRRAKEWHQKTDMFEFKNKQGLRFRLDPRQYVDSEIFHNEIYERRFLEFLRGPFSPDAVALDIGANIGNHAIYMAQFFKTIHAFEPNPTVLTRLNHNISLNDLQGRIVVHPVGLGRVSETLSFRDNNDGNLGGSGFLKPGETAGEADRVHTLQVEAADEYVARLGVSQIDFIKIDVEGWEPSVFEGLRNTIARFRPVVAFEFHGQSAAAVDFARIAASLPKYIFAELLHVPKDASILEKFRWNYSHRGRPQIAVFDRPETRSYENVLAFPSKAVMASFATPSTPA